MLERGDMPTGSHQGLVGLKSVGTAAGKRWLGKW
jgi:hypothetical protein